jgi:hypothetical protein
MAWNDSQPGRPEGALRLREGYPGELARAHLQLRIDPESQYRPDLAPPLTEDELDRVARRPRRKQGAPLLLPGDRPTVGRDEAVAAIERRIHTSSVSLAAGKSTAMRASWWAGLGKVTS